MRTAITPTFTFNPAAGTLNLSGISAFNIALLYEVIDITAGERTIYDAGIAALGYSALSGTTLTLLASMQGLAPGDQLQIIYDIQPSGGGGGGGGAITAADGAITDIGTEADAAYTGTGAATEISGLKGIWAKLAGMLGVGASSGAFVDGSIVTMGTEADAAYASGSGSMVSLLKGIFAKVGGTLVVQGVAGGVAQPTSAASGTFVDGSIATIGTQADAVYASGSGSLVALLKGVFAKLSGTLVVQGVAGGVAQPVSNTAGTSGGASSWTAQGGATNALLTNTPQTVKTGAGTFYGWDFINTGGQVAYVQVFDATAVTLGTTTPLQSKYVPANGGSWEEKFPFGVAFANGLIVAATSGPTNAAAPAAGINANIEFK